MNSFDGNFGSSSLRAWHRLKKPTCPSENSSASWCVISGSAKAMLELLPPELVAATRAGVGARSLRSRPVDRSAEGLL
jgi:hypothetical protein